MAARLLITGADGFTGRHFLDAAGAAGYETIELTSDLTDESALRAELSGQAIDRVLHLAAISAVTHDDVMELYRVNLFGTLNLLRVLREELTAPPRVVVASSANIYGNAVNSPITEDTPPAPVNHYAMSKLAMEHMVRAESAGLPVVIARPFNYTGVGHDERFVVPKIVAHFRERKPLIELGNMDVEREFNDVRTVCQAYLRLLDDGIAGTAYNICSGRAYSLTTVLNSLSELSGHKPEVQVNPAFVRANEVHRLCGDPARLYAAIGELEHPPLSATLQWMLSAQAD
ncbi:MAG: NAD-dependent epimerase/dehydratase family protein [Halioglobus sp.]|nr:NAD-dependent epimerase/dehydratase family protein [Halioglobus sp.]